MSFVTIVSACMYSGLCHMDPRCEMSEVEVEVLFEKLRKLNKPGVQNIFGTGVLGPGSFTIIQGVAEWTWDNMKLNLDDNFWQNLEFNTIRTTPGLVSYSKWENNTFTEHLFEDTENVHAFLAEIIQPAIDNHLESGWVSPSF